MTTDFQIRSLRSEEFAELFNYTDDELSKIGAIRMIADEKPGFPCRVSLQDAGIGEEVILLPYQHHKTNSPYQSAGPVFVRKNATTGIFGINEIPAMLQHRLLSLRGYDENGIMKEAEVTEGANLQEMLHKLLQNAGIKYIHIHNARQGCFNCVAERVLN
jgi:hypothetical protein